MHRTRRSRSLLAPYARIAMLLMFSGLWLALPTQFSSTASAAMPAAPSATVITVDTSDDLDSGSITKTCTFTQGIYVPAADGCTLRRALLEASARPDSDRPIAINFNLADDDPNANLEVNGTWTLIIDAALPALRKPTILDTGGQVTIDGATQPGGRADGPKIIIATNDHSLEIESENNIIRNLAFKGGGVIFLKEDSNTVTDIWMGLSDDGQEIVFRTGQPMRMAGGGIDISSDNNLVEANTITGAFAKAVNISNGNNNIVQNNQIGTRADGTVPDIPVAAQCVRMPTIDPGNWYGGWGISLSGSNNQILNNRIAGLHRVQTANETPPMAIEIFGSGHTISGNIIGVDSAGKEVGVCGQGIKVSGHSTQIIDNQVIGSRAGFEDDAETAIMASDTSPLFGQITVRRNIVKDGPGNVYAFGPGIPQVLQTFAPAKITSINGTTVTGTAGDNSPCPECLIDFYLDNDDANGEALAYLGSTTATSSGDFSFVLASPLDAGMGIRTSSTLPSSGIIPGFSGGTTTKVSKLFLAMEELSIIGPITGEVGSSYSYSITVTPENTTVLIDYTLQTTDQGIQTVSDSQSRVIVATYTWDTPGTKTISVTAENDLSTITGLLNVTISSPSQPMEAVSISGPTIGEVGSSYSYSITVTPENTTVPIDYTLQATDQDIQTLSGSQSRVIVATYTWDTPGTKTISVTAENDLGTITGFLNVTINSPSQPMEAVSISGPTTGEAGVPYGFTITVTPNNATGPFDYRVNATDMSELTSIGNPDRAVVATYTWVSPGVKRIDVTVETELGVVTASTEITIAGPAQERSAIFLPNLKR